MIDHCEIIFYMFIISKLPSFINAFYAYKFIIFVPQKQRVDQYLESSFSTLPLRGTNLQQFGCGIAVRLSSNIAFRSGLIEKQTHLEDNFLPELALVLH
jgi:hypothetical protein